MKNLLLATMLGLGATGPKGCEQGPRQVNIQRPTVAPAVVEPAVEPRKPDGEPFGGTVTKVQKGEPVPGETSQLPLGSSRAASSMRPRIAVLRFQNNSQSTREHVEIENPFYQKSALPLLGEVLSENQSGEMKLHSAVKVERFGEIARVGIEEIISQFPDCELVNRVQADAINKEFAYDRSFGRPGPGDKRKAFARAIPADYLVVGQLNSVWTTATEFNGYNTRNRIETTVCRISISVTKVEGRQLVFSAQKSGEIELVSTPHSKMTHSDVAAAAIQAAVAEFWNDKNFRRSFIDRVQSNLTPLAAVDGSVEVMFKPKLKGASLEIDGNYVGNCPIKRSLVPSVAYSVRLYAPGYEWRGRIIPESGLVVAPTLESVDEQPEKE